jgi:hypothetical protein
MKKLFTFLLLSLIVGISALQAQRAPLTNIDRNLVLVEIATGTWCYYCPGAAMAADELVANGDPVAVVENHDGDSYANIYSNTRNSYYNVSGIPTGNFDGVLNYVGGNHTSSIYNSYLPIVNQRMAIQTPFDVDFTFTDNGNNNFTVSADISKVGDYSNDVVMHVFVTESEIMEAWQGQDHLDYVNRLMVPDENGTALDFSNGNNIVEEVSFDLNPNWNRDNCEIVVAIQDMATKEVQNTAKASMLQATFDYDATISQVYYPLQQVCGDELAPRIEIKNYGGINLTTADIEYSINGGDVAVYSWTGDLAFTETEDINLPAIPFTWDATNTVTIAVTNPNGQDDENPNNNSVDVDFDAATSTSMNIDMQLFVGAWGSQISWEFYNGDGDIIAQGSGYGNNEVVNMTLPVDNSGCYDFYLYDSAGDGFAGGGYLKLKDNGTVFAYITDELEDVLDIPFHANNALASPSDFSYTLNNYDIDFSWTAPAKATLLGYNIYEAGDMTTPINASLITETSYAYTVAGNGNYEFYLVAVYDEGSSDMVGPLFVDISVGINELSNNDLNIYPNPAYDITNLSFNLKESSSVEVSVYTLVGSKVLEISSQELAAGDQVISINTNSLDEGVYFINLQIDNKIITKKINVIK